jgi:hypothetical protein
MALQRANDTIHRSRDESILPARLRRVKHCQRRVSPRYLLLQCSPRDTTCMPGTVCVCVSQRERESQREGERVRERERERERAAESGAPS